MKTETLFSSRSDEWETPQDFFNKLNEEFSFTLDACATQENAKCNRYFTKADDALQQRWTGNVWCNPPYTKGIASWAEKASESVRDGADVVVLLVPARTDTRWFHDWIYRKPNVEIRFVKGRLKFGESRNNAPFPSMSAVFRKGLWHGKE